MKRRIAAVLLADALAIAGVVLLAGLSAADPKPVVVPGGYVTSGDDAYPHPQHAEWDLRPAAR